MEYIKELSAYEEFFKTAVYGSWSRYPGIKALDVMLRVYEQATGRKKTLNYNCQSCVLTFLQEIGRMYFEAQKKVVEQKNITANTKKKVKVQTKKKK